jgi:hypothetical protein
MNIKKSTIIGLLLIVTFYLFSCSSKKFIEINEFDFTSLKGNIHTIHCYKFPKPNKNDSLESIIYYNKKRKAVKQIDFYGKNNEVTTSNYDSKDRLIEEITQNREQSTSKYFYDNKDNLIRYQQLYNGNISFEKKILYDKYSNKIEEIYFKKGQVDTAKFTNNYKERTHVYITKKNDFIKKKYNKGGLHILTQSTYNKKDTTLMSYSYDKKNNITNRTKYINGKLNFKETHKNKYDKKGNLIEMIIYSDGKISSRKTYVIEYK